MSAPTDTTAEEMAAYVELVEGLRGSEPATLESATEYIVALGNVALDLLHRVKELEYFAYFTASAHSAAIESSGIEAPARGVTPSP